MAYQSPTAKATTSRFGGCFEFYDFPSSLYTVRDENSTVLIGLSTNLIQSIEFCVGFDDFYLEMHLTWTQFFNVSYL